MKPIPKWLFRANIITHMIIALLIFAVGLNIPNGFRHWLYIIAGPVLFLQCLYYLFFGKIPEYREIPNERAVARALLIMVAILMMPPIITGLIIFLLVKH